MTKLLLQLKYTGITIAVLFLFWMPLAEGIWHGNIRSLYRDWLHALRYSMYVMRTGDTWYSP